MRLIDMSLPIPATEAGKATVNRGVLRIDSPTRPYEALIYDFAFTSEAGTYIDLPGHIVETDDGSDTLNFPIERLFRVRAGVIHLNKNTGDGPISSDELEAACHTHDNLPALVINALGNRRWDEIKRHSVYLSLDAVSWILARGVRLLVSDVWESASFEGVFLRLFGGGASVVCRAVNLNLLRQDEVRLTVSFLPFATVTQMPCRIVAEVDE